MSILKEKICGLMRASMLPEKAVCEDVDRITTPLFVASQKATGNKWPSVQGLSAAEAGAQT